MCDTLTLNAIAAPRARAKATGRWNLRRFASSPLIIGFGRDMMDHLHTVIQQSNFICVVKISIPRHDCSVPVRLHVRPVSCCPHYSNITYHGFAVYHFSQFVLFLSRCCQNVMSYLCHYKLWQTTVVKDTNVCFMNVLSPEIICRVLHQSTKENHTTLINKNMVTDLK